MPISEISNGVNAFQPIRNQTTKTLFADAANEQAEKSILPASHSRPNEGNPFRVKGLSAPELWPERFNKTEELDAPAKDDWNAKSRVSSFPAQDTPPQVKRAWAEATTGMEPVEIATAEYRMMLPSIVANIKYNSAGEPDGSYGPNDPEFKDVFADFDYVAHAKERLAMNEHSRGRISQEQYKQSKAFWTKFSQALNSEE